MKLLHKTEPRYETVWLGRGGQGAFTAARLLGLSAVRFAAQQAVTFPSFGPERRGAPVFAYTRLGREPISDRSAVARADALIVLDESLLQQVATPFLHDETLVIIDSPAGKPRSTPRGQVLRVDATRIAHEVLGSAHTNTILLGFLIGVTGLLEAAAVEAGIRAEFGDSPRAHKNVLAFRRAFALGQAQEQTVQLA